MQLFTLQQKTERIFVNMTPETIAAASSPGSSVFAITLSTASTIQIVLGNGVRL
jgi:hypothetical protein